MQMRLGLKDSMARQAAQPLGASADSLACRGARSERKCTARFQGHGRRRVTLQLQCSDLFVVTSLNGRRTGRTGSETAQPTHAEL